MKEVIDINSRLNELFHYYAKFTVCISIEKPNLNKEIIHQAVLRSLETMQDEYRRIILDIFKYRDTSYSNEIVFHLDRPRITAVTIIDNQVKIEFCEISDGLWIYPYLLDLHTLEICILKAIDNLTKRIPDTKLKIENFVITNHTSSFRHQDSLFMPDYDNVNGSYIINGDVCNTCEIEGNEFAYEAIERFFQLYSEVNSSKKPYIRLSMEQFQKIYMNMW